MNQPHQTSTKNVLIDDTDDDMIYENIIEKKIGAKSNLRMGKKNANVDIESNSLCTRNGHHDVKGKYFHGDLNASKIIRNELLHFE